MLMPQGQWNLTLSQQVFHMKQCFNCQSKRYRMHGAACRASFRFHFQQWIPTLLPLPPGVLCFYSLLSPFSFDSLSVLTSLSKRNVHYTRTFLKCSSGASWQNSSPTKRSLMHVMQWGKKSRQEGIQTRPSQFVNWDGDFYRTVCVNSR